MRARAIVIPQIRNVTVELIGTVYTYTVMYVNYVFVDRYYDYTGQKCTNTTVVCTATGTGGTHFLMLAGETIVTIAFVTIVSVAVVEKSWGRNP